MILGTGAKREQAYVRICRNGALLFILLLCLCVNSWAACSSGLWGMGSGTPVSGTCSHGSGCPSATNFCSSVASTCNFSGCPSSVYSGYYRGYLSGLSNNFAYCQNTQAGCTTTNIFNDCNYSVLCSSQAEADSVACVQNPSLPGCAVVSDTLLFACSESMVNGQAVATIYRLSCKATNGEITECNGKQNIDIPTDGQPIKQMSGTCAQNGLSVGPFGGASPQDSTSLPNGANAECFAITGATCHMRDKVSGNTFTCGCDGNCNVAIQNLMAGSADCTNPYPQPSSSADSLQLPQSSPSSSGSSSPSSSGSTGSSGSGEGSSGSGDDFEYDYTDVLEAIRANTQYTGNEVNDLNGKANTANEYLRQIANKDFSPTINVSPPVVNVAGDTTIVNVQNDTSRAPAQILSWLTDENYSIDTSGRVKWNNYIDSVQGWVRGQLDTLDGNDSLTDMGDSLGTAVQGIHTAWGALKDSIGNSAIEDSIGRWQGMFLDNGTLTGSGSDNCPQVLLRQYTLSFPMFGSTINVPFGNLGVYICSPVAGTGVNLWVLARTLLRAMVAIACMYWLYKAVLGIDEKDGE